MAPTRPLDTDGEEDGGSKKKTRVDGGVVGTKMLTIISSDGEEHHIEACHLQASSTVFRSMLEAGGTRDEPIVLIDPEIETSDTVRLALKLIVNHTDIIGILDRALGLGRGVRVVRFLKKYDFKRQLEVAVSQIYHAIHGPRNSSNGVRLFVTATWLEDWPLCSHICEHYGRRHWHTPSEGEGEIQGEAAAEERTFDPRTWPSRHLDQLAPTVLWALLRASRKVDWSKKDWEENKAMGEEFVRLMKLPSKSSTNTSMSTDRDGA